MCPNILVQIRFVQFALSRLISREEKGKRLEAWSLRASFVVSKTSVSCCLWSSSAQRKGISKWGDTSTGMWETWGWCPIVAWPGATCWNVFLPKNKQLQPWAEFSELEQNRVLTHWFLSPRWTHGAIVRCRDRPSHSLCGAGWEAATFSRAGTQQHFKHCLGRQPAAFGVVCVCLSLLFVVYLRPFGCIF